MKSRLSRERSEMRAITLQEVGSREYARVVARAWERLIADYPIDDDAVRAVVIDSWRRCQALGVDPARRAAPSGAPAPDVDVLDLANERLKEALQTSLASVVPYLAETRSVLIVSDPSGTLLSVDGDPGLTEALTHNRITMGAGWHEHHSGTNAVGTALALARAVTIHGEEHFCRAGKSWSCSADVVRDPVDGRVLGVVDITSSASALPMHARACVAALVERVQAHLVQHELADRTRLIEAFFEQRNASDALVVFDRRGRVVKATPGARSERIAFATGSQIPGLDPTNIERGAFDALLPSGLDPEYVSPVWQNNACLGGVLRIPPRHRQKPAIAAAMLSPALRALAESSPSLLPLAAQAQRLAAQRFPILLQGETGTGKDVLARAIHAAGSAAGAPFVAVNCAALPRELIASELFGHAEGAFTGARRGGARGRFEEANGGTIFLDEIGDMPLDLQPYLLRVLEDGTASRLGEAGKRRLDVRVIAATNRPLAEDVAAGRFRTDLFYRLDGASLCLPALRERPGDIPALIDTLLRGIVPDGETMPSLSPELLEALGARDWPGNVRELRNVLVRIIAMASGDTIDAAVLPPTRSQAAPPVHRPAASRLATLKDNEQQLIRAAIKAADGSATRAARALGISRATMYRRLKTYQSAGGSDSTPASTGAPLPTG
jgi:sigma-54 dependent transcriptional regulator, acetoin dehydrogenase operon transcriptional activator AcoR